MAYRKRSKYSKPGQVDAKSLPALGVSHLWAEVDAEVLKDIIVRYAAMGDAVLFGTSKSQEVLAIRVYREGQGGSVYSRSVEELDDALGRLEELCPTRARIIPTRAVVVPSKQVESVSEEANQSVRETLVLEPLESLETRQDLARLTNRIASKSKRWKQVDIPTK